MLIKRTRTAQPLMERRVERCRARCEHFSWHTKRKRLIPFICQKRFETASALAGSEFYGSLNRAAFSWYPARSLVEDAVKSRKQHDPSGKLIVFEGFAPWKEHLFLLEEELNIPEEEKPVYVIYPDESGKWRVQAVPVSPDSFSSRKALPEQ